MKWVDDNTTLTGTHVKLLPMQRQHFDELVLLAREPRIWEHIPIDCSSDDKMLQALDTALAEREKGTQFPFVILHRSSGRLIGSTRLMDLQPQHRKLEIGWTWLHPAHWATAANPECKLLLLRHSFDVLNVMRVQLKTDELNVRSRKAILKIGAQYEGILRNDMQRSNGTQRNSAYFSFTDVEWPATAARLHELITRKQTAAL